MIRKIAHTLFSLGLFISIVSCGNSTLGNKELFISGPDDTDNYMVLVLLTDKNGVITNTEPTSLVEANTFNLSYTDIPPEYMVTVLYYAKTDIADKKLFEISPTEYFGSEFVVEPRFYSETSLKNDATLSSGSYVPAELSGYLKYLSKHVKFVREQTPEETIQTSDVPVLEYVYPYPETSLSRDTTELTLRGKNFFEGIKIEILDVTIQEVIRYDTEFLTIILREPLGDTIDNLPLVLIMQNPQSTSISYNIQ